MITDGCGRLVLDSGTFTATARTNCRDHVPMIDLSLERRHEVYLADGADSTVRVRLQPSWALVPGSRLTRAIRTSWVRTKSSETATSGLGGAGATVAGLMWLVVTTIRWAAYHQSRRRDWTVTVSAHERRPVELPLKRQPSRYTSVRTLDLSRHADISSALHAAKTLAADLVHDGYRFQPVTAPVGGDDE